MALTVFNALVAACLAPWFINLVLDSIQKTAANGTGLGMIVSSVVSHILFFVVTGGGIALVYYIMGVTIGQAILIVLVKKVGVDFFRLFFSYLCITVAMLGMVNGMNGLMYAGVLMLLAISLFFSGIDLMLNSVLPG